MSHSEMNNNAGGGSGVGSSGNDWSIGSSWVTLGVLILVVTVLSRVGMVTNSPAMAEMTISDAGYTMMTTNGGNDEILVLIDSREESIMVYRAKQNSGLVLLEHESLSGVFSRARAQVLGGP